VAKNVRGSLFFDVNKLEFWQLLFYPFLSNHLWELKFAVAFKKRKSIDRASQSRENIHFLNAWDCCERS